MSLSLTLPAEQPARLIPYNEKIISAIDLQSSLYETSEVFLISCSFSIIYPRKTLKGFLCFSMQLASMHFRVLRTLVCLEGCAKIKHTLYKSNKTHRFSLSFFRYICVTFSIGKAT